MASFDRPLDSDELVREFKAGKFLWIIRQNLAPEEQRKAFLESVVNLHNSGEIDLTNVPHQSELLQTDGYDFFTIQRFFCDIIPKLEAKVTALMQCCRLLVDRGGNDLAGSLPMEAFLGWCKEHPSECRAVIRDAEDDSELAKQFVSAALIGADDVGLALSFIRSYKDERRLAGLFSLSRMASLDDRAIESAIKEIGPLIADASDDLLRARLLLAAFDVLKGRNFPEIRGRLIEAAVQHPGPQTRYVLAQVIWMHLSSLSQKSISIALDALSDVTSFDQKLVHVIDKALHMLLLSTYEPLVIRFLTSKIQDGSLHLKALHSTAAELAGGDPERLYRVIVRWLISGKFDLCQSAVDLIGPDGRHCFTASVGPLGLEPIQQIFLCQKAIGFLFLKPLACSSIIVSVLRDCGEAVAGPVIDLLFDPILLNYSGNARRYLASIPEQDPAFTAISKALKKYDEYYSVIDKMALISELLPSEHERNVFYQKHYDEMRTVSKMAFEQSVLMSMVHRSTILYGRRSLTYVQDTDGSKRPVELELKSMGTSIELPRRQVLDPVGLDHMLRVFRAMRLK